MSTTGDLTVAVSPHARRGVPASRVAAFAGLAGAGFVADLLSKNWVFDWLGQHPHGHVHWLWPEYFGLQLSLNQGALFGMGQGQVWLFASLSVVAGAGILYWLFVAGAARQWWLTIALGLVMAGVLGNLYDRLGLWTVPWQPDARLHAVRDWILWQYGEHQWPNFNLADSFLVCGAAILVWHAIYQPGRCGTAGDGSSQRQRA